MKETNNKINIKHIQSNIRGLRLNKPQKQLLNDSLQGNQNQMNLNINIKNQINQLTQKNNQDYYPNSNFGGNSNKPLLSDRDMERGNSLKPSDLYSNKLRDISNLYDNNNNNNSNNINSKVGYSNNNNKLIINRKNDQNQINQQSQIRVYTDTGTNIKLERQSSLGKVASSNNNSNANNNNSNQIKPVTNHFNTKSDVNLNLNLNEQVSKKLGLGSIANITSIKGKLLQSSINPNHTNSNNNINTNPSNQITNDINYNSNNKKIFQQSSVQEIYNNVYNFFPTSSELEGIIMKGAIIPNENVNNINKINSNSNLIKKTKNNSSIVKNESYNNENANNNFNMLTTENAKSLNNRKQVVTSPFKINLKTEVENSTNNNTNNNTNLLKNADNLINVQNIINEKQEYINFLLNENEALKKKLKEKNVENKSLHSKIDLLSVDNRHLALDNPSYQGYTGYQGRVSQSVIKNSIVNLRGDNNINNNANFQTEVNNHMNTNNNSTNNTNNNYINKLNVKSTVVNHASPKDVKQIKEIKDVNNLKELKDKKIDQTECK